MSRAAASPWNGDSGLARERSDLSWGRTMLAVLTVTGLFLRWIPAHGLATVVPMGLGVVAAFGLQVLRRRRRLEVLDGHGSAAEEVLGLAALVCLVGLAALILIALGI